MKFSKMTLGLAVLIIASAAFARVFSDWIRAVFGAEYFLYVTHLVLLFICAGIVFIFFKYHFILWKLALFILFLIVTGLIIWKLKLPEEKIHFIEYGTLSWLAARDVMKKTENKKMLLIALGFSIAIGIIDELFQLVLPRRFFDVRDILFNTMGSAWGIILYMCRPVKLQ